MAYRMIPSVRPRAPSQEGFILIEVLVSALILAIVAGAVLTLITATTHSAAAQRAHSVAYGLAQEDQAELRTMQIATLNKLERHRSKEIGGTTYTVDSQGLFVNNKTQTASCSGGNESSDYIQLTSTVSAPTLANPISIQSVVSPTSGSLDPNLGTLAVLASNAAGEPLPGVAFELDNGLKRTSESNGCANFADIPVGAYVVTSSGNPLINPEGKTFSTQEANVSATGVARVTVRYDKAGWIQPAFVYRNSATGLLEPAPVDSISTYNSASGKSTATSWGSPGATRMPATGAPESLKATPLFPFSKSKYTVYAGSCESNNPDPKENTPANDAAMASVEVPPGGGLSPQIQLPALYLTVAYNGGLVQGATVTLTDTKCKSASGSLVKRTYVTNEEGRPAASIEGAAEPGLPWGAYNVCATAKIGGLWHRLKPSTPVTVENLTSGTTLAISLSSSSATSSSTELTC